MLDWRNERGSGEPPPLEIQIYLTHTVNLRNIGTELPTTYPPTGKHPSESNSLGIHTPPPPLKKSSESVHVICIRVSSVQRHSNPRIQRAFPDFYGMDGCGHFYTI